MNHRPLLLFFFAPDGALTFLAEEENALRKTFSPYFKKLNFLSRGNCNLATVFQEFNQGYGRIMWFHFSGHASTTAIQLTDKRASATSLASLLGMEKKLVLVFLNGCYSSGLVDDLLNAGVKLVIATSDAVEDQKACFFSSKFYEAFLAGKSVRQAFLTARDQLFLEFGIQKDSPFFRGLLHSRPVPVVEDLWGVYVLQKDEHFLDLKFKELLRQFYLQRIFSYWKAVATSLIITIITLLSYNSLYIPFKEYQACMKESDCACIHQFLRQYNQNWIVEQFGWDQQTNEKLGDLNFLIIGKWMQKNDSSSIWEFHVKDKVVESSDFGRGTWRFKYRNLVIIWDDADEDTYIIDSLDCDHLIFKDSQIELIKIN